ncbi:MAG: hypothetical protein AB7E79_13230 [Rhodospirillaceae bacterium]
MHGGILPRACRAGRRLAAAAAALAMLASCYLPDRFEAEIRLTKDGGYGVTYIGQLTYAPLFGQIARGTISEEKAKENERMILEQLKRDTAFKEVSSLGRGRYQVRFEREGRFGGAMQMVNFATRNQAIFRIRTTEDGLVQVNGSGQGQLYAARFEEIGLRSAGLVRIVTDAEVLDHNATFIRASRTPGFTQYDWRIRSFRDPPPKFIARLAVDPRTGVPAYRGGAVNVDTEK